MDSVNTGLFLLWKLSLWSYLEITIDSQQFHCVILIKCHASNKPVSEKSEMEKEESFLWNKTVFSVNATFSFY